MSSCLYFFCFNLNLFWNLKCNDTWKCRTQKLNNSNLLLQAESHLNLQLDQPLVHLTSSLHRRDRFHQRRHLVRKCCIVSFNFNFYNIVQSVSSLRWWLQNTKCKIKMNSLAQGFSTFWYSCTPKSKLYPSAYPQSDLYPFCVPPTKKFYPNKLHFSGFFLILRTPVGSSRTPCDLFTYPLGYAYPRLRTAGLADINKMSAFVCLMWL